MYSSEQNIKKFSEAPLTTDYNLHYDVTTCILTTPLDEYIGQMIWVEVRSNVSCLPGNNSMERTKTPTINFSSKS